MVTVMTWARNIPSSIDGLCRNIRRPLPWRHNGRDSVSNHQPRDCLLNRLFRRRSKKTLKLRVTGLCVGNSPRTGEFPAQMASNAENVPICWRLHDVLFERNMKVPWNPYAFLHNKNITSRLMESIKKTSRTIKSLSNKTLSLHTDWLY